MESQLHSPSSYQTRSSESAGPNEANSSGVSWSAVLAGGFVTAALALILLSLGTGLGLSSVSLWSNVGASASAISAAAIIWLIATQIISSATGGYLAGRLRTKWTAIHSDEVYFRDTAHGFLSWAVAIVVTAAFLGAAGAALIGSSAPAKSSANERSDSRDFGANDYFVDALFRSQNPKTDVQSVVSRNEAGTILVTALGQGELSGQDKTYLDQLVMTTTGMTQSDADQRTSEVFTNAKQAAEKARKMLAHTLLWVFVALLSGAFCASLSATFGGRQRDHVVTI